MADSEPEWDLYRTFLAVVRDGSFSGAARRLGLAQPTTGRQIETLESKLGTKLFTRSRRGLVPTRAALAILPHAQSMATASAAASRISSADWDEERGTVRITAGEFVSYELLPSILADFGLRYPKIQMELAVSNRNEDILGRAADVAIRMVRPTQAALLTRRIGVLEMGLFAHRRYVDACGLPSSAEELSEHRFIGFDRDAHAINSAGGIAAQLRREHFGFRCDSGPIQLAALHAGVGIGGHYVSLARRDPNLVPVLEKTFRFRREMWVAMNRDSRSTRRYKLLFDHLVRELAAKIK